MTLHEKIHDRAEKLVEAFIAGVKWDDLIKLAERALYERHEKSRNEGLEEAAIFVREKGYDELERQIRALKEKP